jgi:hypothetical protein
MKAIIYLFVALVTIQSAALADQSANLEVSASRPVSSIELTDQKFEPIYGEEPYEATCSREVYSHHENRCHTETDQVCQGGGQVCRTVNDRVCSSRGCADVPRRVCETTPRTCQSVPRRVCVQVPVTRTEFYSCTRYRTVVVGQRLVKSFEHQIEVVLNDSHLFAPLLANASHSKLVVSVNINEASLDARLVTPLPSHLVHYQILDLAREDQGEVLSLRKRVVITLGMPVAQASKILSSEVKDLELGFDSAKFKLTQVADLAPSIGLELKIKRNRRIGGDSTLYHQTVALQQLNLVAQGEDLNVQIPFERLQIESLSSKRHDIEVGARLKLAPVLNRHEHAAILDRLVSDRLKGVFPIEL